MEMPLAEALVNPYQPSLMRIQGFADETADVRTLRLRFVDSDEARGFSGWEPGQFGQFTVFGAGESVFALANAPWRANPDEDAPPTIECTFRAVGKVTLALRSMSAGQTVGFRGPYGNSFPIDEWQSKDIVFIGGGIGMAALRSAMLEILGRRSEFGDIVILNGARTVADLVYRTEMPQWEAFEGVRVIRTVDPNGETEDWDGEVGLLPTVFEGLQLDPANRVVVACGPPIMLHYLFLSLGKMGYTPDQVVTTVENKMKCGIGHCGRCYIGPFSVCRDGPVVTWAELESLPKDY
jgi:NAD(P)H-flavin reductase